MSDYGTMAIRLLDPLYHNKKVTYLIVRLHGFEVEGKETSWEGEQNINVFLFDDHIRVENFTMLVKFNITNLSTVVITSEKLSITIVLTSLREYNELPILMLLPVLLMLLFIELTKRLEIPPQKLSLVTISIIINFLMYISLLEFYRGIEL